MALNNMTATTTITGAIRGNKTSSDSVTFKVYSNEHAETRLFLMPRQCTTFQAVAARIVDLFGFNECDSPRQQLQVQYTDDENDLVTITTDEELRTALQLFSGKPSLRLIVSVKKNTGNSIQASEYKAFEVPAIQPDHAESVVPQVNCIHGEFNVYDTTKSVASSEPVTLEEASEKLAFVGIPAIDATSVAVGVKVASEHQVPCTTISSGSTVPVEQESVNPTLVRIINQEPKRILTKEERIKLRESRLAMKTKRESMAARLVQLEELGYGAQRGHCLRLLLKNDGDVDQVVKEMNAWAQAKEAREKLKIEREEKKKLKQEYKAKKAMIHAQKKEMIEEKRKRRESMAERKKHKEELKQERCLKKAEMIEKKKLMKLEKLEKKAAKKDLNDAAAVVDHGHPEFEDFTPQLAQLEAMGFKCKHRNVRMLKKFDGDVTKVIDILAYKEAERLQAYAEKHGLAEYEAANKAAFEKLAELGHDNKKLNARLLKQCDGDVDKVILHLRIIEERKRHRAEMARLLGTAQVQVQPFTAQPVSVN